MPPSSGQALLTPPPTQRLRGSARPIRGFPPPQKALMTVSPCEALINLRGRWLGGDRGLGLAQMKITAPFHVVAEERLRHSCQQ